MKNMTLVEMVNVMLSYSGLSKGYSTCYIFNRVPNKRNKITSYELWKQRYSNLNYLKNLGCRAIVEVLGFFYVKILELTPLSGTSKQFLGSILVF